MGILIAILIFGAIVMFHEFGHFVVAKKNDVQVNEFMIGFGPKLVGVKRGETLFSLRLLPLGGACVMANEEEEEDNPRAFRRKPAWRRLLIVAAGPLFNFLLAFILAVILTAMIGVDRPILTGTVDGLPAQAAGLQEGDEITKLNYKPIHFSRELKLYLQTHGSQEMRVTYKRDGQIYETMMIPVYNTETGTYQLGITYNPYSEKVGPLQTLQYGWYEMEYSVWSVIEGLRLLFSGGVSVNDLSGPVGIVKAIDDTYTESNEAGGAFLVVVNMLNIAVLLSANLGVMNLLPIPGLDGGRIIFTTAELITRKQFPVEKEGMINLVGMGLLFALMIFVVVNDVRKMMIGF